MQSALSNDPMVEFKTWISAAESSAEPQPLSMTFSTASKIGRPSSRQVLYKGFSGNGLLIVTNYNSRKAKDIAENPFGALVFFWPTLDKQIRVEGRLEKVSREESLAYFKTRPRGSQLGAWASAQSSQIPSREFLLQSLAKWDETFKNQDVPCPEHWGGYRLIPEAFEFWIGKEDRLHERYLYTKNKTTWEQQLLSP